MNNNQILFNLSILLVATCLISVGVILKRNPPKHINYFYGYRTKNAFKSQKNWDFAQQKGATALIRSGLWLCVSLPLLLIIPDGDIYTPYVLIIIAIFILLGCLFSIFKTERALKKEFDNKKT